MAGAAATGITRRIAQQEDQRHRVEHADDAGGIEGEAPAELRRIGDVAAEAADDHAAVDRHLVQPTARERVSPVW